MHAPRVSSQLAAARTVLRSLLVCPLLIVPDRQQRGAARWSQNLQMRTNARSDARGAQTAGLGS